MSNDACFKCELRSKNNNDRTRHQQRCRDRRRILFRFKININSFTNENSSQRQKTDFSYDDVMKEAFMKKEAFVKKKTFMKKEEFMNSNTSIFDQFSSDFLNHDESMNDVFDISFLSQNNDIFFTKSSVRVKTYEEIIKRSIEITLMTNENAEVANSFNTDDDFNSFFFFHNEVDYALTLWFHENAYIKEDVNKFLKDERLTSVHEHLSFKNENQWFDQINKISSNVSENKKQWLKQDITINFKMKDELDTTVKVQYRDVIERIKFLLSHQFFIRDLSYAFIRQFNDDNERIYTKMHIEDWWWKTQKKILEKTIIVSLLIASDKTMLSQHQNDRTAWFVYLTIDNLSRDLRRSQTRSSNLLLKFISIAHLSDQNDVKTRIWHETLFFMLKRKSNIFRIQIEHLLMKWLTIIKNLLQTKKVLIRCVDARIRRCVSIKIDFICDYEEQILITNIKSEQQCSICQMSSDERENLEKKWSYRIHEFIKRQIRHQRKKEIAKRKNDWIHEVKNFVWKHNLINIHEIMMMNILHQLMKKMIMHLLIWIRFLLKTHLSANRKRKNFSIRFKNLSELDKFDTRFKSVSSFTELKTFFSFSNVKQWIDVKQKTIMRQIILVITSLLIDKWFHAVNFVRAFVDFILIAQYRSHDE